MPMTATRSVEHSGPAIRAVLAEVSPAECAQFERDFLRAMARAGEQFDVRPVVRVLDRWQAVAATRANPLSDSERQLVARAKGGDDAGWRTPDQARV